MVNHIFNPNQVHNANGVKAFIKAHFLFIDLRNAFDIELRILSMFARKYFCENTRGLRIRM